MGNDTLLEPIGPDIWLVDGPTIRFYGLPFPTRMTVIRLADGDLFLHSPTAHSDEAHTKLAALGRIRHLVSPNWIHYAFIQGWADAAPGAVAWASPGVRARAAKMGARVAFDRDLAETPDPAWAAQIDQMIVRCGEAHSEVVFFHRPSRTLILTDLIEDMRSEGMPWWLRPFARLGGVVAPNGRIPLDMWLALGAKRDRLARALARMLAWRPETVVLAHGDILRDDIPRRLREGFRNLAPLGAEP